MSKLDTANEALRRVLKDLGVNTGRLPVVNDEASATNLVERLVDALNAIDRNRQPDSRLQEAIDLVSSSNWTKAELESVLLGDD